MSARRIGETDTRRKLTFTFDGRPYQGLEGDTIASALLANGVKVIGRSFKYHRPRGIYGAGVEEPNGLVDVRDGADIHAKCARDDGGLKDGMVISAGNAAPTAARDRHGFIDRFPSLHSGRLLLQDVPVAELAYVRAAYPRHGGAWPSRSRD